MTRIFRIILELVAWVNIFLIPSVILVSAGFIVYSKYKTEIGLIVLIALSFLGVSLGIWIAEKTRKSIGCSTLIFKPFSSNDLTKWTSQKKDGN